MALLTVTMSLFFTACGGDAPAGNGEFTFVQQFGNQDANLPQINGEEIHFSNFMILPKSSNLSFVFSIDAGGITSLNGTDLEGSSLVLRITQGVETNDYSFEIQANASGAFGVNFESLSPQIFNNFDRDTSASFQILYQDIELLHGQIRY